MEESAIAAVGVMVAVSISTIASIDTILFVYGFFLLIILLPPGSPSKNHSCCFH
jgi:hypothetical protein